MIKHDQHLSSIIDQEETIIIMPTTINLSQFLDGDQSSSKHCQLTADSTIEVCKT